MDLREEASEEDAVEVVELMRHTLLDEFLDGEGMLDFRRAGGKSKQVMRFVPGLDPPFISGELGRHQLTNFGEGASNFPR